MASPPSGVIESLEALKAASWAYGSDEDVKFYFPGGPQLVWAGTNLRNLTFWDLTYWSGQCPQDPNESDKNYHKRCVELAHQYIMPQVMPPGAQKPPVPRFFSPVIVSDSSIISRWIVDALPGSDKRVLYNPMKSADNIWRDHGSGAFVAYLKSKTSAYHFADKVRTGILSGAILSDVTDEDRRHGRVHVEIFCASVPFKSYREKVAEFLWKAFPDDDTVAVIVAKVRPFAPLDPPRLPGTSFFSRFLGPFRVNSPEDTQILAILWDSEGGKWMYEDLKENFEPCDTQVMDNPAWSQ